MDNAHPNAMQGLATGNRAGKSAKREQQIHTPDSILAVCRAVWPEGIALDPCASHDRVPIASLEYFGPALGRFDGIVANWADRTYFNPPYAELKAWLDKSTREYAAGVTEQIGLFPVRPNRVWWCQYVSIVPTRIAWLRPLKFEGYAQAFPAPLCLVYTGQHAGQFERAARELSCLISEKLG